MARMLCVFLSAIKFCKVRGENWLEKVVSTTIIVEKVMVVIVSVAVVNALNILAVNSPSGIRTLGAIAFSCSSESKKSIFTAVTNNRILTMPNMVGKNQKLGIRCCCNLVCFILHLISLYVGLAFFFIVCLYNSLLYHLEKEKTAGIVKTVSAVLAFKDE